MPCKALVKDALVNYFINSKITTKSLLRFLQRLQLLACRNLNPSVPDSDYFSGCVLTCTSCQIKAGGKKCERLQDADAFGLSRVNLFVLPSFILARHDIICVFFPWDHGIDHIDVMFQTVFFFYYILKYSIIYNKCYPIWSLLISLAKAFRCELCQKQSPPIPYN